MKKFLLFFICAVIPVLNVQSNVKCNHLRYEVSIKNSDKVFYDDIFISMDFVKIITGKDKSFLFNLKNDKGYQINHIDKSINSYNYSKDSAFFIHFIVNFGILSNNDELFIPEVVYRTTGKKEKVKNDLCFQVKLPGSFLNSKTYLLFNVIKSKEKGELYSKYLSCFSKNPSLLLQAKEVGGFPKKIITYLTINLEDYGKEMLLIKERAIEVEEDFFNLPKNYNMELIKED